MASNRPTLTAVIENITMKSALTGLLMAAFAVPAFAQDTTPEPPADFNEAAWQAEWDAADTNGDGKLSREEAVAGNPNVAEHFDQIDADGDGFITPEEDKAMLFQGEQAVSSGN